MRAVVQRVTEASVTVQGEVVGRIGPGLCVLVGVGQADSQREASWLAEKLVQLRIFEDESGKLNRSLLEVSGQLLAVSQFTLYGDLSRGRRPSFGTAMEPVGAQALFEAFCEACRKHGVRVETGRFRTHMAVALVNDGPVTLLLDSARPAT